MPLACRLLHMKGLSIMEKMIRILASRTLLLKPDGTSEILEEEYIETPITEAVVRAFCAVRGTTPEQVISAVQLKSKADADAVARAFSASPDLSANQ